MVEAHFDAAAFYAALDKVRETRSLNWKQVAAESGVSASTLTRMAQGRRPDVDSLAKLLAWSGLKAERLVRTESRIPKTPETLAMISTHLRTAAGSPVATPAVRADPE